MVVHFTATQLRADRPSRERYIFPARCNFGTVRAGSRALDAFLTRLGVILVPCFDLIFVQFWLRFGLLVLLLRWFDCATQ